MSQTGGSGSGSRPRTNPDADPRAVARDEAWLHAIPGNKKGVVTCWHCSITYNGGGINRLKYHLAHIPKRDAKACLLVPEDVKRKMIAILEAAEEKKELKKKQEEEMAALATQGSSRTHATIPIGTSTTSTTSASGSVSIGGRIRKNPSRLDSIFAPRTTPGAQPSLEGMNWNKEIHEKAKLALGDFFFYNNLPFNAARSPYWQIAIDAVTVCGAGFKAPNDEEIRGPILAQRVADVQVEIEEQRKVWKAKGCTIMTDGWTDRRNRTLLNFLVSSSGNTMFLKSIDASGKTKNAEYLCEVMEGVLKEVGEENVVQICTDNAANYVAAGKLLMERHPHIFWTPCAAHCIDLMLEDLGKLPWIKTCVEIGRNICKYIYNHTWVLNLMRQHTKQKELSRPGVTRFATNFLMLQSMLKSKASVKGMFVCEEWTTSSYAKTTAGAAIVDMVFDERSFWKPAKEIVELVRPLVVLLRVADGEKPSMGYIYEGMDRVKEAIRSFYAGNQDIYGPLWDIIDRRWHNLLHRPIHAAAYFLNPAYHFSPSFKADEEVWNGLYDVIERMTLDDAVTTSIVREIDMYTKAEGDLFAREICKKNRTILMPDAWWSMFGGKVPNLQRIAIRILSQPSSASGCERNWSLFEHIHSKKRNKLAVKKMNDLVFVHYNLRLRHKRILGTDTSPIVLDNIDPQEEWNTEMNDPVFGEEDLEWVDQVDREAEAVAMAQEEARARGDPVQDPEAESGGSESDDEDYEVDDEEDDDEDIEEEAADEHVTEDPIPVSVQPQTQGERMALESSMVHFRRTRRKT